MYDNWSSIIIIDHVSATVPTARRACLGSLVLIWILCLQLRDPSTLVPLNSDSSREFNPHFHSRLLRIHALEFTFSGGFFRFILFGCSKTDGFLRIRSLKSPFLRAFCASKLSDVQKPIRFCTFERSKVKKPRGFCVSKIVKVRKPHVESSLLPAFWKVRISTIQNRFLWVVVLVESRGPEPTLKM